MRSPGVAPSSAVGHLPTDASNDKGLVLLVEDDVAIRGVYAKVLSSAGHDVHTADNGLQAIEKLAEKPFDVVVSDISMPGMSGMDLLKAIRTRNEAIPVILMTACPDVRTAAEAVERRALRYLLKPVPLGDLRSAVGDAVRGTRLHAKREEHRADVHVSLAELLKACSSAEALEGMWLGREGDERKRYAASFGGSIADEIATEAARACAVLDGAPLAESDREFYARSLSQLEGIMSRLRKLASETPPSL